MNSQRKTEAKQMAVDNISIYNESATDIAYIVNFMPSTYEFL